LACCALLTFAFSSDHNHLRNLLAAPVLTYLTILLGLTRLPNIPIFRGGDYSYGIYLYAYPFQQALVALFPGIFGWQGHYLASVALATMAAMGSWHFIEKPILAARRNFRFAATKRTATGSVAKA
jgi:peptidoglycan/LPS O-acetylase OafA/YrhL